jgi:NADPH2:quinone reductase
MKAVVLRSEDGPDALTIQDRPEPTAGPDEVLIDVQAAGVSFVDALMSRGKYQERPAVPFVPGVEIAGLVRTAPDGSGLAPGDRVAAYMLHGGYAQVAAAPASSTFALPDQLGFSAGTALALNYQTSHFALFRRGHLETGQTVLVHGGGGGVGVAAVQLAKAHGATVIATVRSAEKAAAAAAAGADHVVVTGDGWARQIREHAPHGVHLVLDPVGGPVFDCSRPRAGIWSSDSPDRGSPPWPSTESCSETSTSSVSAGEPSSARTPRSFAQPPTTSPGSRPQAR